MTILCTTQLKLWSLHENVRTVIRQYNIFWMRTAENKVLGKKYVIKNNSLWTAFERPRKDVQYRNEVKFFILCLCIFWLFNLRHSGKRDNYKN